MIARRVSRSPRSSVLAHNQDLSEAGSSGPGAARALGRIAIVGFALAILLALPAMVSADPGDLGFEGPDGTGAGAAPTGSKPQAKLWFNDGSWWASMWDVGTSDFYIWKLNRGSETWVRTNTPLDDRSATRADVLWDGSKLYVASHTFSESDGSGVSRLYRYSYATATDTYTLDAGFPATINSVRSETLVIDKDSNGKLWATWEQGGQIFVNRTTGSDASWGSPFVLPGASGVNGDDISSVIAFGGNKIGVMWSNQNGSPDAMLFAVHVDGQADTTWSAPETALSGSGLSDDHINLKTDPSGNVYAVTKTGLTGSSPLIKFLARATNGSWANYTVATGNDNHTRPILVLDLEHSLFRVYMTHGQSGGPIVEKTSPMGSISWPSGTGTPVIWDASANDMNNATSTKQNVDAQSGLIVAAFEDTTKHYWHADIFGGGGADTTPPTVTARNPAVDATGVAVGSNVTATFSEAVNGVSGSTFTLTGPG
ncbi:MAG TPA: Ig-like domain-containing protein, partial [Candidatus Limnocylindrales bacterium]|nr:Ig-like domain-containing protein [Candidatus Limnocylindrales bacterium]